MLWEAWRIEAQRPLKITVLGRFRANHYGEALRRVGERFPNEPRERLSIRSVKSLNPRAIARAKRDLVKLRGDLRKGSGR